VDFSMSQHPLQIRLGGRWAYFAYARREVRLLGTAQEGMQIGALARLADGSYAQANGDVVRLLNTRRVEHALNRAVGAPAQDWFGHHAAAPSSTSTPTTTVIDKKRRLVQRPPAQPGA
jgi:hypothetical protein